ncbi:hypothetical protein GCM10025865_06520 [Paraoerskovia sediminicola]|uniref:F5/8 type C domain-containing protein n=1 Tax=Paraoerskovia sediminicola TaxID=1138587 RepID=A0ABN6X953_9CELL|nr:DUF1996 domain-containing protein [Paraoerskovia sediminicola]BDZ41353.1 hypothetical protein GCM10025865_06520 [Paraoerskovia sediminicola]
MLRTTSAAAAAAAPTPGAGRFRAARAGFAAIAAGALVATTLAVTASTADAADDANISQGKLTDSSSTEGGYTGSRYAVDGDMGTRWASQFSDDQWLRVDLGSTSEIDRVDLAWEGAYGKKFEIQVSDDTQSWTTIATVNDGTGGNQSLDVDGTGRYVQMKGIERGTGYGYSLYEFQVFGDGDVAEDNDVPVFDDPVTHREFQANCEFSHFEFDDPIVFPGEDGRSHLHTFLGNESTDENTTIQSLFDNPSTTCTNPNDHSAYWYPTLYNDGQPVEPNIHQTIYYKSGIEDFRSVQPFPEGLRFIAGDMMATPASFENAPGAVEGYECGSISKSWSIPDYCDPGSQLNIRYQAPSCWNGVDLDSPNHKSHMAYPVNGECPLTHPVPVPMIEFKIAWPASGDLTDAYLVSGSDQSWHYDFMNGWEPEILDALVRHCINGGLQCNPQGYDLYKPHRGSALTADFELP